MPRPGTGFQKQLSNTFYTQPLRLSYYHLGFFFFFFFLPSFMGSLCIIIVVFLKIFIYIPSLPSPLGTISLYSVSVGLFLFCLFIHSFTHLFI